jgi:dTDP-4-amino-4,6-dideoxygalactose transaminase
METIFYGKQTICKDDIKAVVDTLKSPFLTTGPNILEFEKTIASQCKAKYCVVVSNATAGLHLSSLSLLKKNDKVLTTPNSFIATSNSIIYAKAKPIFIDICQNGTIDLNLCEKYLKKDKKKKIKAIYAVSFSGLLLDYKKLKYLKDTYKIKILQDNAHTMGAKLNSCDISVFSFHPVKHITTGEGGAVVTNDKKIYKKILNLRNHGQDKNHKMLNLGFNYRLDSISCALGLSQIGKLKNFIEKRQQIAKFYDKAFKNTLVKPLYPYTKSSFYHLYIVLIDFDKLKITKKQLFDKMQEKNISLQIHYQPINKQPFYKKLNFGDEKTPNMDKYFKQCLTLPCYPILKKSQYKYIVKTLLNILLNNR